MFHLRPKLSRILTCVRTCRRRELVPTPVSSPAPQACGPALLLRPPPVAANEALTLEMPDADSGAIGIQGIGVDFRSIQLVSSRFKTVGR